MMTRYYKVAGHTFAVTGKDELFEQMGNYEPFECESAKPLFALTEESDAMPEYTERYRQEEGRWGTLIYGHTASGNEVFEYMGRTESRGCLILSKDYHEGRLIITGDISANMLNRSLTIMYAFSTADKDTLLIHAVVVSSEGKGYMFLGPSCIGKSTHARLWLEHIEGTELVNDDFPVIRGNMVYGSPWGGGKTPCYRNVSYPIGGIVALSQAPYNKIHRLSGLEAYMNLFVSASKGFDTRNADGLHQTEERLASTIPMWHLECLPDEAAARLCHDTITNHRNCII